MSDKLLNLNIDRIDLHDAIELLGQGMLLSNTYDHVGVEMPEKLAFNIKALEKKIRDLNRDNLLAQIKEEEGRLETLKTAQEKRREAEARLADLRAKLGE